VATDAIIEDMKMDAARHFADESQDERQHWRSIVLFGRNVASYKFALAKSLLELSGVRQRWGVA
jgi:hypothetical protein